MRKFIENAGFVTVAAGSIALLAAGTAGAGVIGGGVIGKLGRAGMYLAMAGISF